MLDPTRLIIDLQQINTLGQTLAGCLDSREIAHRITEALIQKFDCAFARIWLTDPDQKALSLVASSGLYTHLNGSFAHVPMGSYKVGKIAQNQVPFLSNHLADEPWVKDRDWAIANQIQGFAGYPLMSEARVLGVLAVFSHSPLASEFLEVLQILCLTATIALDAAIQHQRELDPRPSLSSLSDQLAQLLPPGSLMLIGTERTLPLSLGYLVVRTVEYFQTLETHYCRLTYGGDRLSLEAIVAMTPPNREMFSQIRRWAEILGGVCQTQSGSQNRGLEILLELPYIQGETQHPSTETVLSQREHQIMALLAHGHRDRDIAQHLHISESTVKFHVNNTLTKLNAKNRYQAVYEATSRSWI